MGEKLRDDEQRFLHSNNLWNSSKFRSQQNSKVNERSIDRNDNLTRFGNVFPRFVIPSSNDARIRSSQELNSIRKRVPPTNSRISYPKRATRNSLARRTYRIPMNNSRFDDVDGTALGQNSGFSGRKEAFSPALLAKVESTTPFDHVAAIKKITDSLLARDVPKLSFSENENSVETPLPSSISPTHAHQSSVNRYWTSKRSNRTKIRRPSSPHLQSNSKKKNNQNKITGNKNNSSFDSSLKNWPNTGVQNAEDFHNYDKYTSPVEHDPIKLEIAHDPPIRNSSFDHHAPVSQRPISNLQEIVHWMKIPAFVTNGSHILEVEKIDNPVSVAFDSLYQNLEPNEPSNLPNKPQIPRPGFIYPVHRPSHVTNNVIPNRLENVFDPSRNKSENLLVRNPQTHVSQNTVVHFINLDSRRPDNASRVPPAHVRPISSSNAFVSPSPSPIPPQSYPSSSTSKPGGPNRVHIGFTSYEESNNPSSNRKPQTPVVTYDQNCPTILINSYTRINNTIQSKQGCTDLNIVINSHVFNSNVYKSSTPSPSTTDHRIDSENYQNYQVDKYVGTSGSVVDDYYRPVPIYRPPTPQNDPQENVQILEQNPVNSDFEVVQDTQISITSSGQVAQTDSDSVETIGQANDPSPPINSLVRPAAAPPVNSNSDASTGSSSLSPANALPSASLSRPIQDEDEDEDYDLSPTGIMDSITSAFAYLTFDPLHYGFFSLAAAPFTALAAGILGVVTFLYPWLFPSSFGFARANDNAGNGYWSGFEEVVRQSMERYGRMNEWKSKRKKRKR